MNVNNREQDFVLRYFQSGKLDTRKALRGVMSRLSHREETSSKKRRAKQLRWLAIAASLLVLVAVGAYTLLRTKTVTLVAGTEVMACSLPDGTHVTLSPHSSLSYQEDNCRNVEMKGCAFFQVRHDEQHPFDVAGERGHIRVLGTEFQVDERIRGVAQVMVTSGKVFFSSRDSQQGLFLIKGQQARLEPRAKQPELIAEYDVNDVAWATHQLHFDNTPLSEVLHRLSEFNHGVELKASDMNKRLTGDFTTDSISQTIRIIEQTLDIKIK